MNSELLSVTYWTEKQALKSFSNYDLANKQLKFQKLLKVVYLPFYHWFYYFWNWSVLKLSKLAKLSFDTLLFIFVIHMFDEFWLDSVFISFKHSKITRNVEMGQVVSNHSCCNWRTKNF